jgi:hypothetical protein
MEEEQRMPSKKLLPIKQMSHELSKLESANLRKPEVFKDSVKNIRPELLLAFTCQLIQFTSSGDAIWLAAHKAMDQSGATKAELKHLLSVCKKMPRGMGIFDTPIKD